MTDFIYHKPKVKSIRNDQENGTKVICEIGEIALMCPDCFNMIETNVSYTKIVYEILNEVEYFHTTNEYYGTCPNCGEDVKFEVIDINMAKIINILNNKGYYTAFCCEGHIEPDDYTAKEEVILPYIYFYLWDDANVLSTNPLPDTWFLPDDDKDCEIFSIRDNILNEIPKSIINGNIIHDPIAYNGWLKKHWDKEKHIKDLYDWAVSLPDKGERVKNMHYNIVKDFGTSIIHANAEKTIEYQNKYPRE